jgi:hypothetical protein
LRTFPKRLIINGMLDRIATIGALTLGGVAVLAAGIVGYSYTQPTLSAVPTWATITRVGLDETRWRHNVVVGFATADHLIGENIIPTNIFSCHVGDRVHAVKRGVSISLAAGACRQRRS